MEEPLRLLFIGCGGIMNAHLRAIKEHPGAFDLVGVCDPSEAGRAALLESYGKQVPRFSDHEAMLDVMTDKADAVIIGTPHFLHYPQAVAAVEAGLPCLVEKPICNNLGEARKLQALAAERGVTVMAGQTKRYTPFARYARRWVGETPENFGSLSTFALEAWQNIHCWIATKPDKSADFWILDKERAGGGVVVSLGCHRIDLVRYLSGQDFTEASAVGRFDAPFKNGAESACMATLRMENGAIGTLNADYCARSIPYSESFKLYGTQGSIVQHADAWGRYDGEIRFASSGGEPSGWDDQFNSLRPLPENLAEETGMQSFPFTNQLLEFRDAIRDKREPLTGIANNLNTMATIEAIYRSMAAGGKTVKIADL
ncbi:MAG: Gfo/Idh/MocA family protein [Opitutales bacterium]